MAAAALASPLSGAVAVALVVVAAAVALASVDFDTGPGKCVAPQCPDAVPCDGQYTVGGMVAHNHGTGPSDQHIPCNCTIVLHDYPR